MNTEGIKPYAEVFGIIAFVLAIVGFIIPIVGVLFVTPLAIVFGILALLGGYSNKNLNIATVVIIVVNLVVGPTFWLNIGASAFSWINATLTVFDAVGAAALIYLLVKANKKIAN